MYPKISSYVSFPEQPRAASPQMSLHLEAIPWQCPEGEWSEVPPRPKNRSCYGHKGVPANMLVESILRINEFQIFQI